MHAPPPARRYGSDARPSRRWRRRRARTIGSHKKGVPGTSARSFMSPWQAACPSTTARFKSGKQSACSGVPASGRSPARPPRWPGRASSERSTTSWIRRRRGSSAEPHRRRRRVRSPRATRGATTTSGGSTAWCARTSTLVERMTLIWHDWFATSNDGVGSQKFMLDQNNFFRSHALGSFETLLIGITKDPAMLIWLNGDRQQQVVAERELRARADGALHARGEPRLHGRRRARAGACPHGLARRLGRRRRLRQLPLRPELARHRRQDASSGRAASTAGRTRAASASSNPMHASYFVGKLWSYFIPTPPSASTKSALVRLYKHSDYRVRPVVEAILKHPQLYTGPRMIKPPVVQVAGMHRARGRRVELGGMDLAVLARRPAPLLPAERRRLERRPLARHLQLPRPLDGREPRSSSPTSSTPTTGSGSCRSMPTSSSTGRWTSGATRRRPHRRARRCTPSPRTRFRTRARATNATRTPSSSSTPSESSSPCPPTTRPADHELLLQRVLPRRRCSGAPSPRPAAACRRSSRACRSRREAASTGAPSSPAPPGSPCPCTAQASSRSASSRRASPERRAARPAPCSCPSSSTAAPTPCRCSFRPVTPSTASLRPQLAPGAERRPGLLRGHEPALASVALPAGRAPCRGQGDGRPGDRLHERRPVPLHLAPLLGGRGNRRTPPHGVARALPRRRRNARQPAAGARAQLVTPSVARLRQRARRGRLGGGRLQLLGPRRLGRGGGAHARGDRDVPPCSRSRRLESGRGDPAGRDPAFPAPPVRRRLRHHGLLSRRRTFRIGWRASRPWSPQGCRSGASP